MKVFKNGLIIGKAQSIHHKRPGVDGYYYHLPQINKGMTISYAEFTGEHGERTIGDRERIYYVLEGNAEFLINGEKFFVEMGDLVLVPAHAVYNLWPKSSTLKVLLYMEYLDFDNPQKK